MTLTSVADLELVAGRCERLLAELSDLLARVQVAEAPVQAAVPPYPVPATVAAADSWIDQVRGILKRPRVAATKKLLELRKIDCSAIPAVVLEQVEEVKVLLDALSSLPPEFHNVAERELGLALTKGLDDGRAVLAKYATASLACRPLDKLRTVEPDIANSALRLIVNDVANAAAHVAAASRVAALMTDIRRLKLEMDWSGWAFEKIAEVVDHWVAACTKCYHLCSDEGLSRDDIPIRDGMTIGDAESAFAGFEERVRAEKRELLTTNAHLADQLRKLGMNPPSLTSSIVEMRSQMSELSGALADRQRTLAKAMGEGTLSLIESLSNRQLPENLTDAELGASLRKAFECGYSIRLEHPDENV